jgi:hypothetical protein
MAMRCRRVQHSPVRHHEINELRFDKITLHCNHERADRDGDGPQHCSTARTNTPSPPASAVGSPVPMPPSAPTHPLPSWTPSAKPTLSTAPIWSVVMSVDGGNDGHDDDEGAGAREAFFGGAPKLSDGICAPQARPRWRDRRSQRCRRVVVPSTVSSRFPMPEKLATIRKRRPPLLVIPTQYDVSLSVAKEGRRLPPWKKVTQARPSQLGHESDHGQESPLLRCLSGTSTPAATLRCA